MCVRMVDGLGMFCTVLGKRALCTPFVDFFYPSSAIVTFYTYLIFSCGFASGPESRYFCYFF